MADKLMSPREWKKKLRIANAEFLMGRITQGQLRQILNEYEKWEETNGVRKFKS